MKLARVLGAIGRTLITAGVLILLFVAYQLWGTGIQTARAQNRLENDFDRRLEQAEDAQRTTTTTEPTTTSGPATTGTLPVETVPELPDELIPETGEASGRIEIPAIGQDWVFVEGVSVADLKKGPGRYRESPFPGQEGNAAIAGHRTTYGAPFNRVDELEIGDDILVTTVQGRFRYRVMDVEGDGDGHHIVRPNQVEVLDDFGDNRLTLTSCNPKYSARQRIIVVASLAGDPAPSFPAGAEAFPDRPQRPRSFEEDLSGEDESNWPAILLALLCALIWLAAWLIGRKWRKWPAYIIAAPFFLVALFFCFENFSRLLPANY